MSDQIQTPSRKLVLFDGNAILHRAYHAYPLTLQTKEGELTNAVYGFTSTLLTVFKQLKPTHTIVAFDEKGPTFRHEAFDGYKAHRPKMDESLAVQIKRTKEVVETLNIPQFGLSGYEADDVLGTIASQASCQQFEEVVIVTGDRDALQLVTDCIHVFFPARGKHPEKMVDTSTFINEWGFTPQLLIDYKALAGDASDEIPGVAGIGPKTATDLISKFGSVESIYDHLTDIPETTRQKLEKGKEMATLSKVLATINTTVPITFEADASVLKEYDKQRAITLFEELEFRSLIRRLPSDSWEEMVEEEMREKGNELDRKEKKKKTQENEDQLKLF